jgi:KipI family sensor histidine kinase inhibitor
MRQMTKRNVPRETLIWRWVTDRGLRIASGEATLSLYHRLTKAALPGVMELVPADGSLLVVLRPGMPMPLQLNDILSSGTIGDISPAYDRQHEISVKFEGQDLPTVAKRLKLPVPDLVEGLCKIPFRVKFLGFQPGFAYLDGLPRSWHMPRMESPRKMVPAGSVGLGGAYCGIYPADGPGGWHLVGRTHAILFDPAASSPALFQPGDTVRLVAA